MDAQNAAFAKEAAASAQELAGGITQIDAAARECVRVR
jgi:hypothetical protein